MDAKRDLDELGDLVDVIMMLEVMNHQVLGICLMLFLPIVLDFWCSCRASKACTLVCMMCAYLILFVLTQLFCCCPVCLFPLINPWSGFRTKQLRDCDAIGGTLWPRGCHIQSVTATVDHAGTFVPAGVSSTGDLLLRVVAIAVLSAVIISFVVRFAATVEQ